ncbi:MAG: dTDP-4-dehydrorhamnose reductase [Planctomycetes bacterium]|nr:dTDP-4-dehydrorhamnose reductase [Planctomycetota bacterium]
MTCTTDIPRAPIEVPACAPDETPQQHTKPQPHATPQPKKSGGPLQRITIIGARGMLGRDLVREAAQRGLEVRAFASRDELDITDAATVEEILGAEPTDAVINAAGWTNVDRAETNKVDAYAVNWGGPANLAWCCKRIGAPLVHFSSNHVFDGEASKPYDEDAPTAPVNVYGSSKLDGEEAIRSSEAEHLIVRSSWLFAPHGKNFVRSIIDEALRSTELRVVNDRFGRPTSTADLARLTYDLMERGARGTVHAANDEIATWYDLAKCVVAQAALPCRVQPRATNAESSPAQRPRRGILAIGRLTDLVGRPRSWHEAIGPCIAELIAAAAERDAWRIRPETGELRRAA